MCRGVKTLIPLSSLCNPVSGLPQSVCQEWQRKSFGHLPAALSPCREPKNQTAAENGALALIDYLKSQLQSGGAVISTDTIKVGQWLERFISLDDNPRAARLMGEGRPYSIETIELYRSKYYSYIKGDLFCDLKMRAWNRSTALPLWAAWV